MSSAPVRAFVFDVGNTLWFEAKPPRAQDVARMQADRVGSLLVEWGITLNEPLADVTAEIWQAYLEAWQNEMDRERYRDPSLPFLIRGAMAVRGVDLTDEQAEQWWRTSWVSSELLGMQLYPDTLDVLQALKSAGMRIGINTNRPCTGEMFTRTGAEPLGFAQYIDETVCSGDTGYVKPHPSTFELVLARLALPANEVVMVGDTLANDIEPAKALGMRTVWKLNGRHDLAASPAADFAIHDLHEILSLPLLGELARSVAHGETPMPHEDDNEDRY